MNQQEFNKIVNRISDEIRENLHNESSSTVFCACINIAIEIAIEQGKEQQAIQKFREVVDLWEEKIKHETN